MAELAIKAIERQNTGAGAARKARAVGRVPGVVYGADMTPALVSVEAKELERLVQRGAEGRLITLETPAGKRPVILKEVQRDSIKGVPLHVDFHAVSLTRTVHTTVAVVIHGEHGRSAGDRVVVHGARDITVACLPTQIPEHIEVNIEHLEPGESLRAGQISLPAGVTLVSDPDTVLVSITTPKAAMTEPTEAAGEAAGEAEEKQAEAE